MTRFIGPIPKGWKDPMLQKRKKRKPITREELEKQKKKSPDANYALMEAAVESNEKYQSRQQAEPEQRKAARVAKRTARQKARQERINARRASRGKAPRMFAAGGAVTKNAKGHNDYRKSGCTLSTVDNRKKK